MNRTLNRAAEELAGRHGVKGILTDDREGTAELLYYLRNVPLPLSVWPRGPKPHNHFEMTRAYTPSAPQPLLYVTLRQLRYHYQVTLDSGSVQVKREQTLELFLALILE